MVELIVLRAGLLRAHERRCPFDGSDGGSLFRAASLSYRDKEDRRGIVIDVRGIADDFPHPPVHDDGFAIAVDHYIRRFQISVDDCFAIKCKLYGVAGGDQVSEQRSDLIDKIASRDRFVLERLITFRKFFTADQLHREERFSVGILTNIEYRWDAGVSKFSGLAGLIDQQFLLEWIAAETRNDILDGNPSIQFRIDGFPDVSLATMSE